MMVLPTVPAYSAVEPFILQIMGMVLTSIPTVSTVRESFLPLYTVVNTGSSVPQNLDSTIPKAEHI